MDLILIPGLWLDGAVWEQTATHLRQRGHRVDALTLPGQGDGATGATYQTQVDAVVAAVDRSQEAPYVVGHSAASALAWAAADARAEQVAGVAFIGGFPKADGQTYAAFFPCQNGAMAFPGWQAFEGPDSADLDQATRQRITDGAVAVPQAVAHGRVYLRDDRRYEVPATLICPEFTAEQARETVAAGQQPELAAVRHLTMVDLHCGHWPMFSCPAPLAAALAHAAETTRSGSR